MASGKTTTIHLLPNYGGHHYSGTINKKSFERHEEIREIDDGRVYSVMVECEEKITPKSNRKIAQMRHNGTATIHDAIIATSDARRAFSA
jgi:hypothetical protein